MDIDVLTVFKWVLIVLITGFITQFGRMMAQYIVRRIRERRAKETLAVKQDLPPEEKAALSDNRRNLLEMEREKERIKLEKKQRKAEIKAAKKK